MEIRVTELYDEEFKPIEEALVMNYDQKINKVHYPKVCCKIVFKKGRSIKLYFDRFGDFEVGKIVYCGGERLFNIILSYIPESYQ